MNTNQVYTGELYPESKYKNSKAIPTNSELLVNGKKYNISSYNIDGYNYYKLRDLANIIGFNIYWFAEDNCIQLYSLDNNSTIIETSLKDGGSRKQTYYEMRNPYGGTGNSKIIDNKDGTFSIINSFFGLDEIYKFFYVDTYTTDGKLLNSKTGINELNGFGGFFAGKDYNYIAFIDENLEEDDNKEIIRVVKYTKDFERVSSCSITNAYTIIPCSLGSLKMAEYGNELVIHTSRKRYLTSDGLNHQSQLTIKINTDTMKVTNELSPFQENYVSHSFNQFVQYDGSEPVYIDLGDAYPRGVVLSKGSEQNTIFEVPGEIGANYTGVSIGGFEVSNNNYLVTISSIDHNKVTKYTNTGLEGIDLEERDAILLVYNKDTEKVKQIQLTNLIGTGHSAFEPYIVKVNDNHFVLIWQELKLENRNFVTDCVKYVEIDGEGNKLTEIKSNPYLFLSNNCQPQIVENKILWNYDDLILNDYKSILFSIDIEANPEDVSNNSSTPDEDESNNNEQTTTIPDKVIYSMIDMTRLTTGSTISFSLNYVDNTGSSSVVSSITNNKDVSIINETPDILKLSNNGRNITGLKEGVGCITANWNGMTEKIRIFVSDDSHLVNLNVLGTSLYLDEKAGTKLNISKNSEFYGKDYNVSWSVDRPDILEIVEENNDNGKNSVIFKSKGYGEAIVTCTISLPDGTTEKVYCNVIMYYK